MKFRFCQLEEVIYYYKWRLILKNNLEIGFLKKNTAGRQLCLYPIITLASFCQCEYLGKCPMQEIWVRCLFNKSPHPKMVAQSLCISLNNLSHAKSPMAIGMIPATRFSPVYFIYRTSNTYSGQLSTLYPSLLKIYRTPNGTFH